MAPRTKKWIVGFGLIAAITLLITLAYDSFRTPNIVLVTVDTLRADYLSCYNPDAASTVEVDALARAGTQFNQAYTLMPVTLPAHASILTSRPPHELRLFDNGQVYREKFALLSEVLKQKGYSTSAFVSLGVLRKKFGLDRGFDVYNDVFLRGRWYRSAEEINAHVFAWLQEQKKPFFAWIHYSDPHGPYLPDDGIPDTEVEFHPSVSEKIVLGARTVHHRNVKLRPGVNTIHFRILNQKDRPRSGYLRKFTTIPANQVEIVFGPEWNRQNIQSQDGWMYFQSNGRIDLINRRERDQDVKLVFSGGMEQSFEEILQNYAKEVHQVDKSIGQLRSRLKELGRADNTIIVLTSDHGEGLQTHGVMGHGYPLYNELLRVPLLIYNPLSGNKQGHVEQVVDHLDIMPTILDLANIKTDAPMRGRSLSKFVTWMRWGNLFRDDQTPRLTFASTPSSVPASYAVQNGALKLIVDIRRKTPHFKAYDLQRDPFEKNNLVRSDRNILAKAPFPEWKSLLLRIDKQTQAAKSEPGKKPDAEDAEMLKALGYTAQ